MSLLFDLHLALFTTDKHSLQAQLDSIHLYSTRWGLTINVAKTKTKMCVFEKRKQRHNLEWFINNETIEEVDHCTYLGVKLVKTGNLRFAVKALNEQALRAFNTLLFVCKHVSLDTLYLFNKLVTSILLHGSEIWGIYNYKEIDTLHIRFCKMVLCVRKQTVNYTVLGEQGRLPLSIIARFIYIKYWLKIQDKIIQILSFNSFIINNVKTIFR